MVNKTIEHGKYKFNIREVKLDNSLSKNTYIIEYFAEQYHMLDLINIDEILFDNGIETNEKWVSDIKIVDGLLKIELMYILK